MKGCPAVTAGRVFVALPMLLVRLSFGKANVLGVLLSEEIGMGSMPIFFYCN